MSNDTALDAQVHEPGCALGFDHDDDCVVARLCGLDPDMSPAARAALDRVLRASRDWIRDNPRPNAKEAV